MAKDAFEEMARLAALGRVIEQIVRGEKRRPGRPPKAAATPSIEGGEQPKKKRGRPKKVRVEEAVVEASPVAVEADSPADAEV